MNYTISDTLLNKILAYLGNKPYVETFQLIQEIQKGVQAVPTAAADEQTGSGDNVVEQSN